MFTGVIPENLLGMGTLLIHVILVVWSATALVNCAMQPASAFDIHNKLSKPAWLAICAVAVLVNIVMPFGLFSIIAIVAVGVYFADVRPIITGRRI